MLEVDSNSVDSTYFLIADSSSADLSEQYLQGCGEAAAEWRQLIEPKECGRSALDGLITRTVFGWSTGLLEGPGRRKAPAEMLPPLDPKDLQVPSESQRFHSERYENGKHALFAPEVEVIRWLYPKT